MMANMKSKARPRDENMPRRRATIRPPAIAEETTNRSAAVNVSRGEPSTGGRSNVLEVVAPDIARRGCRV